MNASTQRTNHARRPESPTPCHPAGWLALALLVVAVASVYAQASAGALLQSGLYKEDVNGDLEAAIIIYEQVLKDSPKDRAVAAKALLHIGLCYEKLGKQEAQNAYRRLVEEFADQNKEVAEARARLAVIETGDTKSGVTVRQVWEPSHGPLSDSSGAPSPDGRYLSFTHWKHGNLAVRDLATGECRDLTDEGTWDGQDQWAGDSIFSPDGKKVAYAWSNVGVWELRIVGLDGSKPRVLYRNEELTTGWPNAIRPFAWSQDGRNLLVRFWKRPEPGKGVREFALVSVADGSVRVLKSLTTGGPRGLVASLSPDGRYVAYATVVKDGLDIILLSTDGSGREVVLEGHPADDWQPVWTPDGKGIVFLSKRSGSKDLWLMRVTDGRRVGEPQLLKRDLGIIRPMGFTRTGAFFFSPAEGLGGRDIYVASVDWSPGRLLSPPEKAIRSFEGFNQTPAWSPDGRYLACVSERPNPKGDWGWWVPVLVIRDMETGQERELHTGKGLRAVGLHWSPDGRSILCGGPLRLLQLIDVQTGDVTPVVEVDRGENERIVHASWSPDGKAIFYALAKDGRPVLIRYDLEAKAKTKKEAPVPEGWAFGQGLAFSPDHKQVAFFANVNQKKMLMVMPAAGGESRMLHREEDEEAYIVGLQWTPDGRCLLFRKDDKEVWCIPAEGGEPRKLLEMEGVGSISVHPDGKRIALGCSRWHDQVWALENFLPELAGAK